MEWSIIGINLLYAVLGVVLMYVSFRVFDGLARQLDFPRSSSTGTSRSRCLSPLFLSIAIIIAGALN